MRLFQEQGIDYVFNNTLAMVDSRVKGEFESSFENDDLTGMVNQILKEVKIQKLNVDFASRKSTTTMKGISGSRFPSDYDVRRDQSYERAYVQYIMSVSGNVQLLKVSPKTRTLQNLVDYVVDVVSQNHMVLKFGYQTLYASLDLSQSVQDEVLRAIRPIIEELPNMQEAINAEVDAFNDQLSNFILEKLKERQTSLRKKWAQDSRLNNF